MSKFNADAFDRHCSDEADHADRALLRMYVGESYEFLKKDGTPDESAAPVPIAEMIAPTMAEACSEAWIRTCRAHYLAGNAPGSPARCFDSPERAAAFMEAIA